MSENDSNDDFFGLKYVSSNPIPQKLLPQRDSSKLKSKLKEGYVPEYDYVERSSIPQKVHRRGDATKPSQTGTDF
uniref:Uncharacterized protein n=1 Tax=Acrobeloides nanus TaxID=290746 RepID=A0A914DPE9_9BILA